MGDNIFQPPQPPQLPDLAGVMERRRQFEYEREAANAGRYDAALIFKHLMQRVEAFQNNLRGSEEIGIQLANFGLAAQLHIRSIGYKNPNLIEFFGVDPNDNEVTLVQHISQLNFMLIALKSIEEKPYRIGFGR
jgi:hypothetical protein